MPYFISYVIIYERFLVITIWNSLTTFRIDLQSNALGWTKIKKLFWTNPPPKKTKTKHVVMIFCSYFLLATYFSQGSCHVTFARMHILPNSWWNPFDGKSNFILWLTHQQFDWSICLRTKVYRLCILPFVCEFWNLFLNFSRWSIQ